ncbi:PREDICTED: uncharacterized protein LOC106099563 [Papilio polytes]|uniref:uncharacterized protein LOC106099563 n=1 Tax=Papilio polytes TaxID=76194 RepID=UPI00067618D5|nr:PREDICTED: uncharacterized protein LOC106099563 [Papilio polytes]
MTTRQEILDSMINDYKTTMNSDYRENAIKPVIKTVYQEKKPFIREKWTYVKYIHTMRNWDGERAPFDSTIPTKAIIRTNPHNIQPVYEKPKDLELDSVRKTRPRLVMTPAISMDDIEDQDKWNLLMNCSSYTTRMSRDYKAISDVSNVVAPLLGKYSPTVPLKLEKYKQPYVSPEWRMQSTSWDRRQIRDYCDANKVFWLYTKPKRNKK